MLPSQTQTAVSTRFHRTLQRATKLFSGQYGKRPDALVEPSEKTVNVADIELRILTWHGEGPTLVALHGLNNNAWSWARVASCLSPHQRVIAVCQRGHGGSTAPSAGYTLEDSSNDLLRLLDTLGLESVDLAGHSWGGKVATYFTADHANRVTSLALADPALPRGLNGLIRNIPALATASMRAERGPYADARVWEAAGRAITYLQHWDDFDQRLWTAGFHQNDDGSYHHRLPESAFGEILHGALAENIEPCLSRITCPVLLLRPTFTLSFLPGELRSMRKALPQMIEKRIAGDHTFIHTNPLDTAAALKSFLRIQQ